MGVIDAHKRIDAYRTIVTGKEAHSSLPQLGVNAISIAAELIEEIDRIGSELAAEESDDRFDPPVSTVQVGVIEGGTAPNIVPKTCSLHWQVRSLPDAAPGVRARAARRLRRPKRCCRACGPWRLPPASRRAMRAACRPFSPSPALRPSVWRSRSPAPMPPALSPMRRRPGCSRRPAARR